MRETFSYLPSQIRQVLKQKPIAWQNEHPCNGITQSSLEVEPGDVFVALQGERDGHDFIADALKKGASLIIAMQGHKSLFALSKKYHEKIITVKNTLYALGQLAAWHRLRYLIPSIAITGSNGKTTTKEMVGSIANLFDDQVVVSEKNYNNEIGVPFTLFKINRNTRLAVIEMGMNHLGEIKRLSQMVQPSIGVITSIAEAHIEFLGSLENIARAKAEILEGMRPGATLLVPATCAQKQIIAAIAKEKQIKVKEITVNKSNSLVKIEQMKPQGFQLNISGESFYLSLPGKAMVQNLALAATALTLMGFLPQQITKAFSQFKPQEKRLNVTKGYFTVIDDSYNANAGSLKSSIDAALQLAQERQCYGVLGDFKEVGRFSKKLHFDMGEYCRKAGIAGVFSFGDDARYFLEGFYGHNKKPSHHFTNNSQEIDHLCQFILQNVPAGSVLLVKGSRSMKMERIASALSIISQ